MKYLEMIDNYFSRDKDALSKHEFEKMVRENSSFAEEVAFYISVHKAVKEDV